MSQIKMYQIIKPLLFKLDPERAHSLTLRLIKWAGIFPPAYWLLQRIFEVNDPRLAVEAFGLKFKNSIGLAAGYDKNGVAVKGLSVLGFGHIEIGTVTLQKQIGNLKPRVHRVPAVRGLINSMGFPNDGVDALRIKRGNAKIGINIGKSKETAIDRAAEDYCELLKRVYTLADYVTVNVSSPNTLNLRQLQAREAISVLLKEICSVRNGLSTRVPLLVKIAPDLNEAEIDDVLDAIALSGIDGIIATNTTIGRAGLSEKYQNLKGGLSGAPLRDRSTAIIRYIANRSGGKLPIIGVGGIVEPRDAIEKLAAGAKLVQIYTGLIYSGPSLVKQINQSLLHARSD
ncbi:MAG TPA: quinone-dependent dihydroorotate dehydrogenase [Anaerolineae bacterium]|nr:quinone-dependent dihydroorotate dehydrogenase [Anaerolineae bacterium]